MKIPNSSQGKTVLWNFHGCFHGFFERMTSLKANILSTSSPPPNEQHRLYRLFLLSQVYLLHIGLANNTADDYTITAMSSGIESAILRRSAAHMATRLEPKLKLDESLICVVSWVLDPPPKKQGPNKALLRETNG